MEPTVLCAPLLLLHETFLFLYETFLFLYETFIFLYETFIFLYETFIFLLYKTFHEPGPKEHTSGQVTTKPVSLTFFSQGTPAVCVMRDNNEENSWHYFISTSRFHSQSFCKSTTDTNKHCTFLQNNCSKVSVAQFITLKDRQQKIFIRNRPLMINKFEFTQYIIWAPM